MDVRALKGIIMGLALVSAPILAEVKDDGPKLYRYKNSAGVTVIEPSIPAKYVANGYDILTSNGRLIKRVAPALTEDEIVKKKEEDLRTLIAEAQKAKQQEYDKNLLSKFSSVVDVDMSLERQLRKIKVREDVVNSDIDRLSTQKERRQRQAASLERKGQQVPPHLLTELNNIDEQIKELQVQLGDLEQDRDKAKTTHRNDRKRVEVLLGQRLQDTDKWPEDLQLEEADIVGSWFSRMENGDRQELVINKNGGFTWLEDSLTSGRRLVMGTWQLLGRELKVQVASQHYISRQGKTKIEKSPGAKLYHILDLRPDGTFVMRVGSNPVFFKRN